MATNPISYDALCDLLVANPNVNSLYPLIQLASKLDFNSFSYQDAWMALGWMRQYRLTKEPIFFRQTKVGLVLTYKGFNNAFKIS